MLWQKQIVIITNAYKILCAECHFKCLIGIASFNPHNIPLGQKLLLGKRDRSIASNSLGHHFRSGSQGRNWVNSADRSLESSKSGCGICLS